MKRKTVRRDATKVCTACDRAIDTRGWKRHVDTKHGGIEPQAITGTDIHMAPVLPFEKRDTFNNYKEGFKDGVVEGMKLMRDQITQAQNLGTHRAA